MERLFVSSWVSLKTSVTSFQNETYHLAGCVYAYVILLTLIGPEHLGRRMEVAYDNDLEEAAGHEAVERVKYGNGTAHRSDSDDIEKE